MPILCLAIVGKNNEPLYLCDCEFDKKNADDDASLDDLEDVFGFAEQDNALSLDKEFMMHASLDHLEEALGMAPGLPSRRQTGSHWLGFICNMGDAKCYAYATATNVKIIAMVKNPADAKLKILFAAVHDLYVKYTMNPFSKIQGKVVSKRFSQGVKEAVDEYIKSTASSS